MPFKRFLSPPYVSFVFFFSFFLEGRELRFPRAITLFDKKINEKDVLRLCIFPSFAFCPQRNSSGGQVRSYFRVSALETLETLFCAIAAQSLLLVCLSFLHCFFAFFCNGRAHTSQLFVVRTQVAVRLLLAPFGGGF